MRFRFMGLPVRRLPYLFAQSYTKRQRQTRRIRAPTPRSHRKPWPKTRSPQTQPYQPGVSCTILPPTIVISDAMPAS